MTRRLYQGNGPLNKAGLKLSTRLERYAERMVKEQVRLGVDVHDLELVWQRSARVPILFAQLNGMVRRSSRKAGK